jgi:hypothetical protein
MPRAGFGAVLDPGDVARQLELGRADFLSRRFAAHVAAAVAAPDVQLDEALAPPHLAQLQELRAALKHHIGAVVEASRGHNDLLPFDTLLPLLKDVPVVLDWSALNVTLSRWGPVRHTTCR